MVNKINIAGISFHVGSQNEYPESWTDMINEVYEIYNYVKIKYNVVIKNINIGGGLPSQYNNYTPSAKEIIDQIEDLIHMKFDNDTHIFLEPGRYLSAQLGKLVTSIVSVSIKNNKLWVFVD
ncbi:MAG: hypothetical protein QXV17_07515 [Candidatus Micrarchaeaceae archaeon]